MSREIPPSDPKRRREAAEVAATMWRNGLEPTPPAWVFQELPHLASGLDEGRRLEAASTKLPKSVERGRRKRCELPIESR